MKSQIFQDQGASPQPFSNKSQSTLAASAEFLRFMGFSEIYRKQTRGEAVLQAGASSRGTRHPCHNPNPIAGGVSNKALPKSPGCPHCRKFSPKFLGHSIGEKCTKRFRHPEGWLSFPAYFLSSLFSYPRCIFPPNHPRKGLFPPFQMGKAILESEHKSVVFMLSQGMLCRERAWEGKQ